MLLRSSLLLLSLLSISLPALQAGAKDDIINHKRDPLDYEVPVPVASDLAPADPSFKQNWEVFFPSEPEIPIPNDNLFDFLKVDSKCRPAAQEMQRDIQMYGDAGWYQKNSDADDASRSIQKILRRQVAQSPECFESVAKTYAVSSLQLLGRKNFGSWSRWWRDVDTVDLGQLLLGAFLANEGHLQFLSQQWKSESPENARVRGAYSCPHQVIYLDWTLPPLNMAATFVHEMDHLFRDLYYGGDQMKADFLPVVANDQAGWNAFILMDESLAIMASSFDERSLQADRYPISVLGVLSYHDKNITPFQLKDDVPVFSPGGALDKLFSSCKQWSEYESDQQLTDFLERTFLEQSPLPACGDPNAQAGYRNQIYNVIYDGYFKGASAIGSELAMRLSPSLHGQDLDPYSSWIWNNSIIKTFYQFAANPGRYSLCDKNTSYQYQCLNFRLEPFIAALAELHSKLGTESTACQLYQASGVPLLGNYIGNQIGVKPSGDGARPDGGVKPSGDGARPDGGVKPSGDGARPDLDGFRPCYDLHDEI